MDAADGTMAPERQRGKENRVSRLEQRGESYPVYPDFEPNMSFRGPKELWAEWTPPK